MSADILTGVITALVAVIGTLVGLLKLYLPRHDRNLHNPWAEKLLEEMRYLKTEVTNHNTREEEVWKAFTKTLDHIDAHVESLITGRKV